MTKRLMLFVIIGVMSSMSYASCSGSWGMTTKAVPNSDVSNIPSLRFEVELSEALRRCDIKGISIDSYGNGMIRFEHDGQSLFAYISDESGKTYSERENRKIFIPFKHNRRTHTFELKFVENKALQPGLYSGILVGQLQGSRNNTRRLKSSVRIYPYLSLAFQGATLNNNSLDMGVLKTGAQKSIDMIVGSNSGYSVKIESEYGGLMHQSAPDQLIPYSIRLGGRGVSFGERIYFSRPGTKGNSQRLSIIIDSVQGAMAGSYKDYIRVTAIANP
ncbi:hypothetical protein [Vibrio gallicus]|uniref:hypothetical protein n=1 Tax=Vibrio gallicus TaxID=190897 RepID=UPI0021C31B32|nr:hypothetical protein [Vibrio gallicus]